MANYTITRKLGTGTFGNVYSLQTGNSGKFALKIVNTSRLNNNEEDCANEGTLMLKLCHAHLVHCYDAFICSPYLYLIMELCYHGSLEQFLSERRSLVPEKQILSWMAQLADVLRYLHALKVIHRDLKPANIFLDENQSVKLGDLGVARELDHTIEERHTTAGTLPYMSPEAFSGLPYNYKTDVWSLGCCLHEAMTLRKTFQGHSWSELHYLITTGQVPEMPSLYQRKLKKLVLSLLNVDPIKRPDALEILLVIFQIQGKRFSSEPSQPVDAAPFDHKQICRVHKLYEVSTESNDILPLKTDESVEENSNEQSICEDPKLSMQSSSGGISSQEEYDNTGPLKTGQSVEEQDWDRSQRKSSANPARHRTKKKKILKSLKTRSKVNQVGMYEKDDSTRDSTISDSDNPRFSPLPSSDSNRTSSQDSQQSQSVISSNTQPYSDYMEALTRDSILWLRHRSKQKPGDPQFLTSDSTDKSCDEGGDYTEDVDDDDDDDDNATCGLVTLFTQSQTVVYINNQSTTQTSTRTESNTPEDRGMSMDLTESVIKAAQNAVKVFHGEDPNMIKLMLIKILGLHGFTLYGQQFLQ